jgi:hypothetical protein
MHGACGVIDTACTIGKRFERPWQPLKGISIKNTFENRSYLGEFEAEFKKALVRESGAQGVLFDEKKPEGRKSRGAVPLTSEHLPRNGLIMQVYGIL